MRLKTFALCAALLNLSLISLVSSQVLRAQNSPVKLTIHADQPVSPVSPTLYGLMTEEINYSYDGGLYAEMVRNRTFRSDWSGVNFWYLVESGNSVAKMEPDKSTGPSTALSASLRLDVQKADAQNLTCVLNTGWWGMAVKANTEYK